MDVFNGTYRYANDMILRLPGEAIPMQFQPTSDRSLWLVYVVVDDAVDQYAIIARNEEEIRFQVARMSEYTALGIDDLEIVVKHVASLRPSREA